MKIALLSSLDPTCIHNWSGTLYNIYTSLSKRHHVIWIGAEVLTEVRDFHTSNGIQEHFMPEKYAMLFGKLLSNKFQNEYYDLIVCRDYYFSAYLVTDIPLIYIGDTTFRLFNKYLNIKDIEFISMADNLEQLTIQKADRIIYCSEWAKESAIKDYQAQPEKIEVIEFGANMRTFSETERKQPTFRECNLLFIGTNWEMKGGEKLLDIYNILTKRGMQCTLSIVGCKVPVAIEEKNIKVYPFIDKAKEKDYQLLEELFMFSHFLIVPTLFDCYGIAFCEAAAYAIPSLASNVGGVSQIIKNGQNGFLFSPTAQASEYADKIIEIISNGMYKEMSDASIASYKNRLNWDTWLNKVDKIFKELSDKKNDSYIPVYVINMKDRTERKAHIMKEFENRKEFDVTVIEACTHEKGTIGLWNSIINVIHLAQKNQDEVIIICEDDHFFTEHYSCGLLLKEIKEAYMQGADILSGGIGGFGQAISVGYHRYWVDWLWCTQFIVIYEHFFETILTYTFKDGDTADGVLSQLSANKMVIYPFISEQKDFGYSDVTQSNMENQGRIREHFKYANKKFEMIRAINSLNKNR